MRKNYIHDFKNDVLFKYCLHDHNDKGCHYLLKLIIGGILKINCKVIRVMNPDLNPLHVSDKDMILDVSVEDENHQKYDIEMQNSRLTRNLHQRFQVYGAKMVASQEKVGDDYIENMRKVFQIIFVDDVDKDDMKLMDVFTSRNADGKEEKFNLITRVIVYLPYINEIVKQKGLKKLTPLELAIYIFKNGIDSGIMKLDEKVVGIMKEKMEQFNADEMMLDAAYKRSLNRHANERDKQEAIEQAREETQKNNVFKIFKKLYPEEETEFLENLTFEQYECVFDILLNESHLEDIKNYIEKK